MISRHWQHEIKRRFPVYELDILKFFFPNFCDRKNKIFSQVKRQVMEFFVIILMSS